MANILGERVLKLAREYSENKKEGETFLEYYADYLDRHLYIEKLEPKKALGFIDEKLEEIRELSKEEQNEKIKLLVEEIKKRYTEEGLLKNEETFNAMDFLALTTLGRIKESE